MSIIRETFGTGGWLKLNKIIGRELGLEAAVMLGNLIDKSAYFDSDIFFMIREHIEFETTLTPHQQRKGEKQLQEAGLIIVKAGGHPTQLRRVNYYGIHEENIEQFLINNKRSILDKKQERQDFYANCLEEVRSLTSSTTACEIGSQLHVNLVDGNKNKGIRTKESTTREVFEEVKASTPAKGIKRNTTALDDLSKEVVDAYRKQVDSFYMPEPADIKHINSFKYKEKLIEFMPYWSKYNGTHIDYLDRSNNVDYHDKNNTAQLYVITRHWNNFNKFATKKILAEKQYTAAFGEQA